MSNYIVILTVTFPYKGEYFLNDEVQYLSRYYDKVYIIPTSASKLDVESSNYKLPINCEVLEYKASFPLLLKFLRCEFIFELVKNLKISHSKQSILKTFYRFFKSIFIASYISKKFKGNNYNQVLFYSYWLNANALGLILSKNHNMIISRAHGSDIYHEASLGGFNSFQSYMIKKLDRLYTISNDGENYLKNLYPAFSDRISTRRLGVKVNIAPSKIEELQTRPIDFLISCSRVDQNKRVHLILDIAVNLIESNIISEWIHFGSGPEFDNIEKKVNEKPLNIKSKISLKGYTEKSSIIDFYVNIQNKKNLFINLSISEGIPVSIMEAMSVGIPAIATNVGGTSEVVNELNGFLIDNASNSKSIVATTSSLILDFKNLNATDTYSYKKNAYNMIKNNFSMHTNYNLFAKELRCINK